MSGRDGVEGFDMVPGLYRAESSHPDPNIDQGSWERNVEGYSMDEYSVLIEVCPSGFKIDIKAEYEALHEVAGRIGVDQSVTIYDENGFNHFEDATSVGLLEDGQYLIDYSTEVSNKLNEGSEELLDGQDGFTSAYISQSEASGSLFGGKTLQNSDFFGSGQRPNSTVSEPQSAVLMAEWMLYNMDGAESSMEEFFNNSMNKGGDNSDINIRWIIENFVADEKYPGGIPTASSELEADRIK